jgi:glyoxylase-like metal-dependent hydrolase (beta-lactamase superfamily II)
MRATWRRVSEHCWLVPGGVNAVVLEHGGRAALVDSGRDADAGKRLARGLRERGWRLEAILTTHAHADHFGGHAALLRAHDVPVLAPAVEAEVIRASALQPIALFHGAAPLPELTGRWLQAEPCRVDTVVAPGPLELIGLPLELLAVDGHAHRQLAVRVDDVLLAADAVFAGTVIARHPLLFAHDVRAQREAALRIGDERARLAIPGHGAPDAPALLAGATITAIDRARAAVQGALAASAEAGATTGEVLSSVSAVLRARIDDLPRWHLNHTAISAYLAAARAAGEAEVRVVAGSLRWYGR